ncbi:MAG: PD-(D/E)XK nuclease family protein [Deltaproteobacteria bacterium]|jgi:hypothetical protein|nr:PD-(D/E)XK nuclease family protein [Deltaproteobacteria bacterium]
MRDSFLEMARSRGSFLGRDVLVVVPSWPALAEYRDAMLKASRGGAVLHPNVTTVDALERELARDVGGRPADRWQEAFLMGSFARELMPVLGLAGYGEDGLADDLVSDLARELSDGIKRIRLAGVPWDRVRELEPKALAWKVAELGERHERWLAEQGAEDREGRRRRILDGLVGGGLRFGALEGVRKVRFLEFRRLSPFEADLAKALAVGRQVLLSLWVPEWATNEIDRVRAGELKRRLIEDLEETAPDGLEAEFRDPGLEDFLYADEDGTRLVRDVPAPLRYAAANLFGPPPKSPPPPAGGRIRIVRAPNPYMECENAVRLAKALAADGADPSRIAVVVPGMERFRPMLEDCARRLGTALAFPGGEPLDRSGPALAVRDLLSLFGSVWERRRVARLLLNPCFSFGFTESPLEALRTSGLADDRAGAGFADRRERWAGDPVMAEVTARVGELKALEGELSRAASSGGWGAFTEVFRRALSDFGWATDRALEGAGTAWRRDGGAPGGKGRARPAVLDGEPGDPGFLDRLERTAAADIARDKAARDCLAGVMDELCAALAAAPPELAPEPGVPSFRRWLARATSGVQVPDPAKSAASGMIRIFPYYGIHGCFFEALFLLGLNEKGYPTGKAEGAFWPRAFRNGFKRYRSGRSLWTDAAERSREEEETAAAAFAQTRLAFVMFSAKTDDGKDALPSALVESLIALWPGKDPGAEDGGDGVPGGGGDPDPWAAAGRLRVEAMGSQVPPPAGLLASHEELRLHLLGLGGEGRAEGLRRAGPARAGRLEPRGAVAARPPLDRVPPETVRLWLDSLRKHDGLPVVNVTTLAGASRCPRRFWYGRILRIGHVPEAPAEWGSPDQGQFMHDVLFRFLSDVKGRKPGEAKEMGLLTKQRLAATVKAEAAVLKKSTVALGRMPVFRDMLRKTGYALVGWLDRQEGFRDREIIRLEWDFGPPRAVKAPRAGTAGAARGGAAAAKGGIGADPQGGPLLIESARGPFLLEGRADRVDRLENGEIRVIDYKLRHSKVFDADRKAAGDAAAWSPPAPGLGPVMRPLGITRSHLQLVAYRLAAGQELAGRAGSSAEYEFIFKGISTPERIAADPGSTETLAAAWENLLEGSIEPLEGVTDTLECQRCPFLRLCDRSL